MPPSPALRYSPGREPRAENHKRGRSLEGGLLFKEKDDDLALFNEMQSREREDFLLQSADDFEDSFATKLRYFSDFKLGVSIPARGESSEFLNVEGEKNDYDWLLTPPETPLFPSLEDEPPPVNVASRGRPRSQPISISRSSTMEKSHRSSRGSASPNRLSPSPRSGNSTFQSRGRPSSASYSSPTPSQRAATPSRRPSPPPPPSKASTPAPRSSTPTPRRMSTGSGARGTSPIRTSRGNSASPKIRAWQSNIPGFSSEAPPNLRTSLADRPASYVRGSSPASRNNRDSGSKFGRQSMSPASRSVSSSHSHDRDRISSHSKGSVASSGDDDVDSLQSTYVGSLDRLASKRSGGFPNNRAPALSKNSTRVFSPSSAPKKSFDSALRQMDHRKSPQNMFRPLLSSVPSTTFYNGKASSAHRSLMSRNSSVTTSSNASSDQGTSMAPDTDGGDHHQENMETESGRALYPDAQEEVFAFDKVDTLNKDAGHDTDDGLHFQLHDLERDPSIEYDEPGGYEECRHHNMEISSASDTLCVKADLSEVDSLEKTRVCSKCGCRYSVAETLEKEVNLCPDCCRQDNFVDTATPDTATVAIESVPVLSINISEKHQPSDEPNIRMAVPELQPQVNDMESQFVEMVDARVSLPEDRVKQGETSYHEQNHIYSRKSSLTRSLMEGGEHSIVKQGETSYHEQNHIYSRESSLTRSSMEGSEHSTTGHHEIGQPPAGHSLPSGDAGDQQLPRSNNYPSLKAGVSEGAGISVLLKRSSSSKGPVVQSRTLIASTIAYDDLSYTRDSANSLRSSIGHGSTSASSSIDFSTSRQVETRVQRQLSGRKSDLENYRYDKSSRPQSTTSSGTLNDGHQALGLATNSREENVELSVGNIKYDGLEETPVAFQGILLASENKEMDVSRAFLTDAAVPEEDLFEQKDSDRKTDVSPSDLPSHTVGIRLEENPVLSNHGNFSLYENGEDFRNNAGDVSDVEASAFPLDSSVVTEHNMLNTSLERLNVAEIPAHSRLASISEIEAENNFHGTGSENDDISTNLRSTVSEIQDHPVPTPSDNEMPASVLEHNMPGHADGIIEESTVMVDCQGGSKARSLTLEEATDTILFCSSIVHDLAYHAATTAIEKESSVALEGSWPTVTILGKSTADRKDPRGRPSGKRASKSLKVRQKRAGTDAKHSANKTENDENANESMVHNVGLPNEMDSMKPPKLESKCNCTIM
ncbi:GASTRIC MUCIN-LIKE PROTEIN [Salix viminalis]|uniref:GASTRIC MUCIN-LIKE PROTEIN n=1 Tax=Salix viminalis TaxID=40686 RepID=A0A9Q0U175_SALVM|nr:GASTRIC MUCIN-LIKE PROTEIN [Salix viminalis]